jgi:2-haloacid dehalogenase
MQAFADVEALVFDVFGTIVDWRNGVAREAEAFLARHAPGADPLAFADAWRRRYSPAMEEVRSGRRAFVRLDVLHRRTSRRCSPSSPSILQRFRLPNWTRSASSGAASTLGRIRSPG